MFEEAGVLLARDDSGALVRLAGDEADCFAGYRREMHANRLTILELVERERLRLAADRLHPFSRWITPPPSPRRYDTWFFVAYLPEHQTPLHDERETTAGHWIAPAEALRLYAEGSFPLVFATERHLERMARYPSIEGMIAAVSPTDLEPVMPRMAQRDGEMVFLIPGDEGYEE
jgi:hypothetical protein